MQIHLLVDGNKLKERTEDAFMGLHWVFRNGLKMSSGQIVVLIRTKVFLAGVGAETMTMNDS